MTRYNQLGRNNCLKSCRSNTERENLEGIFIAHFSFFSADLSRPTSIVSPISVGAQCPKANATRKCYRIRTSQLENIKPMFLYEPVAIEPFYRSLLRSPYFLQPISPINVIDRIVTLSSLNGLSCLILVKARRIISSRLSQLKK